MMAYVYGALAALVLGMGLLIWTDQGRIRGLEADLKTETASLNTCKDVNTTDLATVNDQAAQLANWQAKAKGAAEAAQQAAEAARKAALDRDTLALKVHQLEATDNATPACSTFLAMDLAATCPGHAQAARERAR